MSTSVTVYRDPTRWLIWVVAEGEPDDEAKAAAAVYEDLAYCLQAFPDTLSRIKRFYSCLNQVSRSAGIGCECRCTLKLGDFTVQTVKINVVMVNTTANALELLT